MNQEGNEDKRKRFATALASMDGNTALLRELGPKIAERYAMNGRRLAEAAAGNDLPTIENIAHQLRSTWALYGPTEPDLPERLEMAARRNNVEVALPLAKRLSDLMQATSADLTRWLDGQEGDVD